MQAIIIYYFKKPRRLLIVGFKIKISFGRGSVFIFLLAYSGRNI